MKRFTKVISSAAVMALLLAAAPVFAEGEAADTSQVADASDMTTVEDVTEDGMTPVYGGQIKDGTYQIEVKSSSSMFRITDSELTVKDGEMTAVMTMGGKGYLYVYMGTGEEAAEADASEYISFEENADGAHTFTVPVEALDQAVSCAAFSAKKEKWYDRSLCFLSSSLPEDATVESVIPEDGEYTAEVTLTGGSGKASVESPAKIVVTDGVMTATIIWSSPNYDYMIVGGEKYLPVEITGVVNSAFEIPVAGFDFEMPVKADTVAMSEPHEISYTLNFDSSTLKSAGGGVSASVIAVIAVIVLIALIAGIFAGRRIAARKNA